MYKSVESFALPFYDLAQPFKKEIEITVGEFWKLQSVKGNDYTLKNRKGEWIEIPEWQFNKSFKKELDQ